MRKSERYKKNERNFFDIFDIFHAPIILKMWLCAKGEFGCGGLGW
jgi:hypothetical protein